MIWIRGWQISPRAITMAVSGALAMGALMAMVLLPVPYAIQSPGPTLNTVGENEGLPELISVEDATSYPSEGQLRLTTVMTSGGPGYPVHASQVIAGWARQDVTVLPVEVVFAPGVSQNQISNEAQQMMTSSQTNATVAALEELGHEVPVDLLIAGAAETSNALDKVVEGDEIVALSGPGLERTEITSYGQLLGLLGSIPAPADVTLEVLRDGESQDFTFQTLDDGQGGSLLGIFLDPVYEYPVDIQIHIENVGGPSAGLMFALGIVDEMTPGDLTGGLVFAGTGTIALDGSVGPIGGVVQKMHGALRDDAEYFLVPIDNCAEAEPAIPDGLTVIPVETLTDARNVVEQLGSGDDSNLPACPVP